MKAILATLLVVSNIYGADLLASFKLVNGIFTYDSEQLAGSASTFGSPSLVMHWAINPRHLLGITSEVHFNMDNQTTSLYAIGVNYRYYFHGVGTYIESKDTEFKLKTKTKWSSFLTSTLNKYTYFLGSNIVDEDRYEQNGSFFNVDLGIGTEYDIAKEYRVFTDVNYTFFSFASSDDRVKLRGFLFSVGIIKEY